MLLIKHTFETSASPETVWKIWEDVENWKTWDHNLEFSHIDGPFKTGTTGTLKPKGGPVLTTTLTLVEPKKIFIDEAKLTLARVIMTHSLTKQNGRTLVTQEIEMKGPLAYFFAFVIGRDIKKNLPHEMAEMIKRVEAMEKKR